MAMNPYTLYSLYEKGILEYVPTDLLAGTPVAPMSQMSNPYMNLAMQGGLYQNHGTACDSFQITSPYSQTPNSSVGINSVQTGALSNAGGLNSFLGNNVGVQSQANVANSFGFNNVVGAQSNAGIEKSFGGFSTIQNGVTNGYNKTMSIIDRTPKFILGLFAGTIGVLGIMYGFKRGKKPSKTVTHTSFLSKLNPKNWFKNKK